MEIELEYFVQIPKDKDWKGNGDEFIKSARPESI